MFKAQQYKWILALRYWEGIVTKVYSHWWELGHAPVVRSYHHKDDWFYFENKSESMFCILGQRSSIFTGILKRLAFSEGWMVCWQSGHKCSYSK